MISVRKVLRMSIILFGAFIGLLGSRDIIGHFLGGSGGTTISLIDTVRADVPAGSDVNGGTGGTDGDDGGGDCP